MIFTPLGDALQDKSGNKGLQKQEESGEVVEYAIIAVKELLGDSAKKTKPLFLKNRTLTITCDNQKVAQEVRDNQQAIVDKINDKLGKKDVDRIRYLL